MRSEYKNSALGAEFLSRRVAGPLDALAAHVRICIDGGEQRVANARRAVDIPQDASGDAQKQNRRGVTGTRAQGACRGKHV